MILPPELISEVKALRLSVASKEVALDICNGLYQRSYLDKFTAISKTKYNTIIGSRKVYSVIKALINADIILRDGYFIPKEKSYYYKLAKSYSGFIVYNSINVELIKMHHKQSRKHKYDYEKLPNHIKVMAQQIKELKWDFVALETWILTYIPTQDELLLRNKKNKQRKHLTLQEYTLNIRESMLYSMENIKQSRPLPSRDETSQRLHTIITNMKTAMFKKTKTFFLTEIDLKNSQFWFLKVLLEQIVYYNNVNNSELDSDMDNIKDYNVVQIPPLLFIYQLVILDKTNISTLFKNSSFKNEVLRFSELVDSGKFYEHFMNKFNLSRPIVKILMFEILFSKNTSYRKDKAVFIKEFPLINQFVEWMKKDEHNLLAITLQKIESYVIIDMLCKRLVEEGIIPITKHDSIAIPKDQVSKAHSIMIDVFTETCGSIPSLTVKPLN